MSAETEDTLVRDARILRNAVEEFYNAIFGERNAFSTKVFDVNERLFRALEMVRDSEIASTEALKKEQGK